MDARELLREVGATAPHILLPKPGTDLAKYSVIACDQFSAQPEYWDEAAALVGGAPSTLNMILPEARLGAEPKPDLCGNMRRYIADGALADIGEGCVYVERTTASGTRRGLILALDLEEYSFSPGGSGMIRATEGTIMDRLPPRIAVRREAPLELPHILVLIDDRDDRLFGMLSAEKRSFRQLYDFDLMLGGGRLCGRHIGDEPTLRKIAEALLALRDGSSDGLLYAMGDGNHSFAAAKACWEELKPSLSPAERDSHPARHALVELVNLYDPALRFEPIHRLLTGVDPQAVQREIGFDASCPPPLQKLQPMLDEWLARHPEAKLEYIHGEADCRRLGQAPDALAIILPPFDKNTLFDIVRTDGALARKSFSMGSAREKRYYLEARLIK